MTGHSAARPAAPTACGRVFDAPDAPADLLAALELILPFAATAPDWAIHAAQDAIAKAKGDTP